MLDATTNVDVVADELGQLHGRIMGAVEQGVEKLTEKAEEGARQRIQEIESAPIPTSSTGRPLWEHTGALLAGVGQATRVDAIDGGYVGEIGIGGEAAEYALHRHQLGATQGEGAWMPQNPAGGVVRHNEFFRDEASEDIKPDATRIIESEIAHQLPH